MAKNNVNDWDETANNNTDIGGINIAENQMQPSSVNNAMRAFMAQIKAYFKTDLFRLRDNTDETKLLTFDLSNITTGTTRTITMPDEDVTLGDNTPAGTIAAFGMSTEPSGWLECDGAEISRATYADLFAAIGDTWGAGDGSTTFNVPDLRGEFVRGWDNGRGIDGGRSFASFQGHAFQTHQHTTTLPRRGGNAAHTTPPASYSADDPGTGGGTATSTTNTNPATGTYADETRPRNYAVMFCIKY